MKDDVSKGSAIKLADCEDCDEACWFHFKGEAWVCRGCGNTAPDDIEFLDEDIDPEGNEGFCWQ